MSKFRTTHLTSIVAALFFAAMFVNGCGGADDTDLDDETADTEEVTDEEAIGEAESAIIKTGSSGGGADFCGWFCPVWAKDLSDCLMIPCKD